MFYTQKHNIINDRHVWHHLIDTPIGQINVVIYEDYDGELNRILFDGHYDKAERKFENICKAMLSGKL